MDTVVEYLCNLCIEGQGTASARRGSRPDYLTSYKTEEQSPQHRPTCRTSGCAPAAAPVAVPGVRRRVASATLTFT